MSIKVLRGKGRISQMTFVTQVRRLYQGAILYPTRNVWDEATGKSKQVPTLEAQRLKELESDNVFDLITDKITKANDSMMNYITGVTAHHDWQLNRVVSDLLGDSDTLSLCHRSQQSKGIFVGSNASNPHMDKHITLYEYTGELDEPRMPYKKSLKNKILMRKDWAVKYLDWRNKNTKVIADYKTHLKWLRTKQEAGATKRQLLHTNNQLQTCVKAIDKCNATLDADITKYNAEQAWLAAMPKHLLKDRPAIVGLMRDPVVALNNHKQTKAKYEESARGLETKLSLMGMGA